LEEESQWYVCAAFEKATESECNEVGEDKRDGGRGSALRANQGLNHRHPILPTNRQWNKGDGYFGKVLICRYLSKAPHRPPRRVSREGQAEVRLPLFVRVNFKWLLVFR
jgi:hypothetical protein